jgi:hypothetical protein
MPAELAQGGKGVSQLVQLVHLRWIAGKLGRQGGQCVTASPPLHLLYSQSTRGGERVTALLLHTVHLLYPPFHRRWIRWVRKVCCPSSRTPEGGKRSGQAGKRGGLGGELESFYPLSTLCQLCWQHLWWIRCSSFYTLS